MQALKDVLTKARAEKMAVGHFNVGDFSMLQGIFQAAHKLKVPVIVGFTEGERSFLGVRQCAAVVKSLRAEYDFPIFLNADHTHSIESAVEVVEAGFDSVVFDLSSLAFAENIQRTQEAIPLLRGLNPQLLIEGEVGDIGTGSQIHDSLQSDTTLTTPEEAATFVRSTGVDALAPAVGNQHGMTKAIASGSEKKHLDIDLIRQLAGASDAFLTLHGGSGTDDADLRSAIDAGISVVHINTELRVAWRSALEDALKSSHEIVPYKLLPGVVAAVANVAENRLRLFNKLPM